MGGHAGRWRQAFEGQLLNSGLGEKHENEIKKHTVENAEKRKEGNENYNPVIEKKH